MTKRGKTLARAIKVLRRLETGSRFTLNHLAFDVSCSERTIRRDLAALEEAGVPLIYSPGNNERRAVWWMVKP